MGPQMNADQAADGRRHGPQMAPMNTDPGPQMAPMNADGPQMAQMNTEI